MSEQTQKPISSWDIEIAKRMARDIKERYSAAPYGFYFSTRERGDKELDSKVTKTSGIYYLGGKVETLAEVKARATADDQILVSNMEINKYDRIITNTNSWRFSAPLNAEDVVLDWAKDEAGTNKGSEE